MASLGNLRIVSGCCSYIPLTVTVPLLRPERELKAAAPAAVLHCCSAHRSSPHHHIRRPSVRVSVYSCAAPENDGGSFAARRCPPSARPAAAGAGAAGPLPDGARAGAGRGRFGRPTATAATSAGRAPAEPATTAAAAAAASGPRRARAARPGLSRRGLRPAAPAGRCRRLPADRRRRARACAGAATGLNAVVLFTKSCSSSCWLGRNSRHSLCAECAFSSTEHAACCTQGVGTLLDHSMATHQPIAVSVETDASRS